MYDTKYLKYDVAGELKIRMVCCERDHIHLPHTYTDVEFFYFQMQELSTPAPPPPEHVNTPPVRRFFIKIQWPCVCSVHAHYFIHSVTLESLCHSIHIYIYVYIYIGMLHLPLLFLMLYQSARKPDCDSP
jgi:hypothetical protein